jgi:sigma-B regulation protein RsbU (phosphoserine phosphatase)
MQLMPSELMDAGQGISPEQTDQPTNIYPALPDEVVDTGILKHDLLRDIPYELLAPILSRCQVRKLAEDEVLITPGQLNEYLYLLVGGRLQVYLDSADSAVSFPVERGQVIGEMSIIEARRTSAFVIAETPSVVLMVHQDIFWEKMIHLPGVFKNMLQLLTKRMRNDNKVILESLEDRLRIEQMERELENAGKIQLNMLPRSVPLLADFPRLDVAAMLEPAREVGGDFFDAFALGQESVCISVGDVSGKGMAAALFMVRAMTLLRTTHNRDHSLIDVVPAVNQLLCHNNDECMFVTLFIGVFDTTTGRLTYINCGHNPPFLARRGERFELMEVPRSLPLGLYDPAKFKVGTLDMHPGDTLVIYTDGVTEAEDIDQNFYTTARAAQVLHDVGCHSDATTVVKALADSVTDFARGLRQSDDITILALRYRS